MGTKNMIHVTTTDAARLVGICTATLRSRAKNDPLHPQPIRATATLMLWDVEELRAFYSLEEA